MRIVVCIKEVLDPSAVNNYALAGSLKIGPSTASGTVNVAFDKAAHEKLDQDCLKQALVQKKDRAGDLPAGDDLS